MDLGYFATVVTQQVSVEQLAGLGLHEGDTLHVLSQLDSAFLVSIVHARRVELSTQSNAAEWLRTVRGSVHFDTGGEAMDLRMSYYPEKYAFNKSSLMRVFFGY